MWARARSRFLNHRLAVVSLGLLVVLFSVGFLAGHLAPYGYGEINPEALSQAPSWAHPFGTNQTGRDYLSRVLFGIGTGARSDLGGLLWHAGRNNDSGVCAGYFGGRLGEALMRFTDLLLTLPALVTILVAAAYLHTTTTFTVALLLSCLLWMPTARILRGVCLSLREMEYVDAARAVGASDLRIIVRHILPNAIGSITVALTVMTANAIVLETTLAYLGFGIPIYSSNAPKPQASLGNVISDANVEGLFHWWGTLLPRVAPRGDDRLHLLRWRRAPRRPRSHRAPMGRSEASQARHETSPRIELRTPWGPTTEARRKSPKRVLSLKGPRDSSGDIPEHWRRRALIPSAILRPMKKPITHDLIAIWSPEPIEMVAEKVAAALGVALVPRESSYWGDPYYSGWPKSEIKLTENLDPMFRQGDPPEERWFCSEARDASYLIWETQGNEAVLAALRDAGLSVDAITPT